MSLIFILELIIFEFCQNEMMQVLEQSISDGYPMTVDQICDKVLRTRSDYIYGLEVGPRLEEKSSSFMSKKRLQKKLEQSQQQNQEMKNEFVDIKVQMELQKAHMEHQQRILEALCASQNISLPDL